MSDIIHWFTIACAVYVAKGIVVALTLVAWALELRDWWRRRREVQLAETWDDTTLVSACDEPTIVERPSWADESRVSAAAKLGGGRR